VTATSSELFVAKKGLFARSAGAHRKTKTPVEVTDDLTPRQASARHEALKRVDRARKNLQTVFQPIVDLRQGHAVGAEALTRFGEERRPDEAFAEAASVGMGVELELSAVHSALTNIRRLPSDLYLSINASADAIVTEEFISSMASVATERIVLELTEHFEVSDYAQLGSTLQTLRESGMKLAVDDAGSWLLRTPSYPQPPPGHHQARYQPDPRNRCRPGPPGIRFGSPYFRAECLRRAPWAKRRLQIARNSDRFIPPH
jgi:predicted signal transduction protein with EAL and GGDEF domain